ncbi:MAG TPA: putative manganese-dependent inorganic diphosphatase [Negativicutes bacterium]|nr:putative manganese-dependent inorganic diphosphatase [Negativicutes bacterium]
MRVNREISVIGHKNPDTDSICSSIAYANLKNILTGSSAYHPGRIGEINSETLFVLNYFKVEEPVYMSDVKTQVKDISIRRVPLVDPEMSLKKAWETMKSSGITTLGISKDGSTLDGIIAVDDIAHSFMDIYDNDVLSKARTPYRNMVEVLEGEIVVGDIEDSIYNGNVLIGAMNPEVMEGYIHKKDIVITGNRYESQLCAIENGAQCIVVTGGLPVAGSIKKIAQANQCAIVISAHDTYTVARLINQSIPIRQFMISEDLVTFNINDYVDDVKEVMVKKKFRNFPVVDDDNNMIGMISRTSLINLQRKQVVLVDHNEMSQAVTGLEEAEILEIIDHHRIGDIETTGAIYFRNQPLGCTATIIRNIYKENNIVISRQIAGILCAAILSDTLAFKSPTCTVMDREAAEELAAIAGLDKEEFAIAMFRAGSNMLEKSAEELFYQDFKQFKMGELELGVGQINSMDSDELTQVRDRILEYMQKVYTDKNLDMVLFMLTDIYNERTELLYVGNNTELISKAFDGKKGKYSIMLPGVLSRKKQVIPPLLNASIQ